MNPIKISTILLFALWGVAGKAQTEIKTIDGVYIERDTVDVKNNRITKTYDLAEQAIINNDVIVFDIPGIGEYLEENKLLPQDAILLIENIPLPEFPGYVENMESGLVRFEFSEKQLTNEHRQQFYDFNGGALKELQLGIKVGAKTALNYSPRAEIFFSGIDFWSKAGWVTIGIFTVAFIFLLVKNKSFLKSSLDGLVIQNNLADPPEVKENIKKQIASYSFSKVQLAFWTFIVIVSFIYIWAFTGSITSINATALVLLGISTVTISVSNLINVREESIADPKKRLELIASRSTSHSFWKDIVSDKDGVSIHRFQALIFNLVFGLAFIQAVMTDYSMPTFSETQLVLLGLSNGTYAFLKSTENKTPENKTP